MTESSYSKADLVQWLLGAFSVNEHKGNELNFPCPVCGHPAFYFNVSKQVGYCHRASCHRTFSLQEMIDLVGYAPDLAGYVPAIHNSKAEKVSAPLTLPATATPILPNDPDVEALFMRGVTWENIKKFNLHKTDTHIIVPIYENGALVQFNTRRVNKNVYVGLWFRQLPPGVLKYKYADGLPINNYLFGWDEARMWNELVLVENTFVSIWLRDLNCTTNFGSFLSDVQVDKIVHSNVKKVTILWDEGANSQRAQRALKKAGIPCRVIYIEGQPDNYEKPQIQEWLNDRPW